MSRDGGRDAYDQDRRNDNSSFLEGSSDSDYDSESSSGSEGSTTSGEEDYDDRGRAQGDQKWTSGAYTSAASSQADDEFSGRERDEDSEESSYESETDEEEDRTLPSIPPPPPTPTQSEMESPADVGRKDYDDESSGDSDSQQSGSRDSQSLESEERTWDDADASAAPSEQGKMPREEYDSEESSESSESEENTVEEGNAGGNWAAFDDNGSAKNPADSSVFSGTQQSAATGAWGGGGGDGATAQSGSQPASAFTDDLDENRFAQARSTDPFGFGQALNDDQEESSDSESESDDEEEDSFFNRAPSNAREVTSNDDDRSGDDDDHYEAQDRLGQLQELQQPSQESFDGDSTITTKETQWDTKGFPPLEQGGFEGSQAFDESVFDQSTLGEESKMSFGDSNGRAQAVPEGSEDFRAVMLDDKVSRGMFMSEVTLDTDAPGGQSVSQEAPPDIESPERQDSYLDFPDKPRVEDKSYCWGIIKDRCDMAIAFMFTFVVLFLVVSVIVIELTPWAG